jgi:hypothetical protein
MDVYAMGFYWPKPHPIPPAGHPMVKGIISGQLLYDSHTPYEWTQEMKMAFRPTNEVAHISMGQSWYACAQEELVGEQFMSGTYHLLPTLQLVTSAYPMVPSVAQDSLVLVNFLSCKN